MSIRDYLASRPVEIECDAVRAALDIAGDTGCALHIVHVSSGRALALIVEARASGVDVTAETCPHYLLLDEEDVVRIGAAAKCAPPVRNDAERDALWRHVRAGDVDTIGSDHSPSPWAMKVDEDFGRVWGGIGGVQHTLPLLVDAGLAIDAVARLCAEHPARRFRLASKGRLEPGADADLTLLELGEPRAITADSLLYRHRISPYVGRAVRARVRRTLLRGVTVYRDGQIIAPREGAAVGQLLRPS
jgi:allantoinase